MFRKCFIILELMIFVSMTCTANLTRPEITGLGSVKDRTRRNAVQFGNMISCALQYDGFLSFLNIPWDAYSDFDGYGCWCGLGPDDNPITVDGIDNCCKVHDKCYEDANDNCPWYNNAYTSTYDWEDRRCDDGIIECTNSADSCDRLACECDKAAALCYRNNIYNDEFSPDNMNKKLLCKEDTTSTPVSPCLKHGDIEKLTPKGASGSTARQSGLQVPGVPASKRIMDADIDAVTPFKSCFQQVGSENGIHPALIAAIASRVSRCGLSMDSSGYGSDGEAYGILQCHPSSGLNCDKYSPTSCEHVEMMVKVLLVDYILEVGGKHIDWTTEQKLQGAVAAYHFGVSNVHTWRDLDVGSVNGDFSNDVIARAQYLISHYSWTCTGNGGNNGGSSGSGSHANTCKTLMNEGNCEFYSECVDAVLPCQDDNDYAISYGKFYCNRFDEYYNDFTEDGKVWADEVRICLMKELYPHVRHNSCKQLKSIAFESHVPCYLESGKGFCEIALSNKQALWNVFQLTDFLSVDAVKQVYLTFASCLNDVIDDGVVEVIDTYKEALQLFKGLFPRQDVSSASDISSECLGFAADGDCRFYECFEQRFPCAKKYLTSHLIDFELPYCKKYDDMWTDGYRIGGWITDTERCLMNKLTNLYQEANVDCFLLSTILYEARVQCMVDADYCHLEHSDELFIERALDNKGYPFQMQSVYSYKPLAQSTYLLEEEYFIAIGYMRKQIGQAYKKCHGQDMYRLVMNQQYGVYMKIRNEL